MDSCPHPHPGILIVDIKNPASPAVVGEIPAPLNPAGQPVGITSREVRVWPEKKLLMTMNFLCSSLLHACPPTNNITSPFDIKFFSRRDPLHPQFISHYVPTSKAGVQVFRIVPGLYICRVFPRTCACYKPPLIPEEC